MVETEPEKSGMPTVDASSMKYVSVFFYGFLMFSIIFAAFLRKLNA